MASFLIIFPEMTDEQASAQLLPPDPPADWERRMNKNDIGPPFRSIDEARYMSLAEKKCDCAVFTSHIPDIFVRNPKRIHLRSVDIASTSGIIFYRPEAEEKARKISNIFSDFDYKFSGLLSSRLKAAGKQLPGLSASDKTSLQACSVMALPGGICPHDGIEYALMQKKLKHIAWFEGLIPVEFITNPLKVDFDYLDLKQNAGRIYYLPGFEITARELRKILIKRCKGFDENSVRLIGRLLGYQPADIETFIYYC